MVAHLIIFLWIPGGGPVTSRKKFLIVGGGGREAAFALRLAEDTRLYAVAGHKNPLIADCVGRSGGQYHMGDHNDPRTVLDFAKKHAVDYVFVNADQPLANGVVDELLAGGIRAIGGTKDAARIEWDKVYSIEMMHGVCPEFTPFFRVVSGAEELAGAISEFESRGMSIVVKPRGLTGGKGVKVMPEHLETYADCSRYAAGLLEADGSVLLAERLHGAEFTIMGITDGKNLVMAPASYDYPFRCEGDTGDGTGGMGCFTGPGMGLPFLDGGDLDDCRNIMQRIIDEMRSRGLRFNGVLNGGFFKTPDGIRFMEFNARFGDPEVLNVLGVLESSFSEMLARIWDGTLSGEAVSFLKKACVTKYMVAREYPGESQSAVQFSIDEGAIARMGVSTYFASCVRTGEHEYETLKKSRVVAFGAISETVEGAAETVNRAIDGHVRGSLEYRRDIGTAESLGAISRRLSG